MRRLRYRDHTRRAGSLEVVTRVLFEPVDRPSLDFSAIGYNGRANFCQSLGHGETKAALETSSTAKWLPSALLPPSRLARSNAVKSPALYRYSFAAALATDNGTDCNTSFSRNCCASRENAKRLLALFLRQDQRQRTTRPRR